MSEFRHFERADSILRRALELEPAERPAYVDQACGEEGELWRLVKGLLRAVEEEDSLRPGGALDGAVWTWIAENREEQPAAPRPTKVSRTTAVGDRAQGPA